MDNKPAMFIRSLLNMESPLKKARTLNVLGLVTLRGDIVQPIINIQADPSILFMEKAITQIRIALKSRNIPTVRGVKTNSKYKATIS